MEIVYIIPRITHGGGMPNVLTEVKTIRKSQVVHNTLVVSLEPGVSKDLLIDAVSIGLKTLVTPKLALLKKLILQADLLVIHYWNCPSMYLLYRYLQDQQLECRICVNLKVNGCTPPQIVPKWVHETANIFIHSNPLTSNELPNNDKTYVIPSLVNLPNKDVEISKPSFDSFKLFHAGTLNSFKVHPQFVHLHSNLSIKKYHLNIWGAGVDNEFLKSIDGIKHISFNGFSSSLYNDIGSQHLLCNPQSNLSYASYDKVMLESQWLGKPVIVLKDSFVAKHIKHMINGIVANDEYEYKLQIEKLAADEKRYSILSRSTYDYTHSQYSLADFVEQTFSLYSECIKFPKKAFPISSIPLCEFDAVLDGMGEWKDEILKGHRNELSTEERNYILKCEGGLIHFYNSFAENEDLKKTIQILMN